MKIFKDGPQRHSKHIDIRREYVLDNLNQNECKIVYIPGEKQLSDFLTKPFKQKTKEIICKDVFNFGGGAVVNN